MESNTCATMVARVIEVRQCALLVCDLDTRREVLVHTDDACRFSCGERICIHYSGAMTMSIPPQISATCVTRLSRC